MTPIFLKQMAEINGGLAMRWAHEQ
jgi:hypothetical protein